MQSALGTCKQEGSVVIDCDSQIMVSTQNKLGRQAIISAGRQAWTAMTARFAKSDGESCHVLQARYQVMHLTSYKKEFESTLTHMKQQRSRLQKQKNYTS